MENYVEELTIILRDGEEHTFKFLQRPEALKKSHEHARLNELYKGDRICYYSWTIL